MVLRGAGSLKTPQAQVKFHHFSLDVNDWAYQNEDDGKDDLVAGYRQ